MFNRALSRKDIAEKSKSNVQSHLVALAKGIQSTTVGCFGHIGHYICLVFLASCLFTLSNQIREIGIDLIDFDGQFMYC